MHLRNHRDLYAGLMFIVIGLAFAIVARDYDMGTPARMGPAFFPTLLGIVLTLIGLVTIGGAFSRSNAELRIERMHWQPPVFVLGGVALFAFTLPTLGYLLSMVLLIVVSSFGGHDWRLRDTLLSCVVLLVFSWGIFIELLSVQFPTWPAFVGR